MRANRDAGAIQYNVDNISLRSVCKYNVDNISLRSVYDTTDRTRDSDILTEVAAEGGTPDRGGGGSA